MANFSDFADGSNQREGSDYNGDGAVGPPGRRRLRRNPNPSRRIPRSNAERDAMYYERDRNADNEAEGEIQDWEGRQAFTLIELLIVILVICILAAITLQTYHAASEAARRDRTKAQIAKIDEVLGVLLEQYITRRGDYKVTTPQGRADGLTELMSMELPDRVNEVLTIDGSGNYTQPPPTYLNSRPMKSFGYCARARAMKVSTGKTWSIDKEGSECLFLILRTTYIDDAPATEFLHDSEIKDTDDDGMPEIVDGWDKPIAFIRYPSGFVAPYSAIQISPMGPLNAMPLVVSGGGDNSIGLMPDGTPVGTPPTHGDNIHNHLKSSR